MNVQVWDGLGDLHDAVSFGENERVLRCGGTEDVLAALPPATEVVDGHGAFVCPGFVDPHVHVRAAASARLGTDVSAAVDAPELLAAVQNECARSGGWATLFGLQAGFRLPDRRELDAVSNGVRVRVRDRSGHAWLLNSAAFYQLGIDVAATSDDAPAGVTVERGPDRTPTGFVVDHVGWVGATLGPVNGHASLTSAVRSWSRELARAGVVALTDVTSTNRAAELRSLLRWRQEGVLVQEITALTAPDATIDARSRKHACGIKFGDAHDRRLPDAFRGGDGLIAVHCVDAAETGAVIAAASSAPGLARGRLRLEHASFVPPEWLPQVRRLGATVVTHPSFVEAFGDRYLHDPDLEPHDWLYRLASWARAGVPLAFGSDAPFGPPEPLRALRSAATRRTAGGYVIGPNEAISGEYALRAVTATAAACSGLERFGYGRLEPGGPAAAVVLTLDPRRPENLTELQLVATIVGGAVVG